MGFIELSFSPYRGNLSEEIGEILLEDHEMVVNYIKNRGLIFIIAYILVMSLSVLKVMFYSIDHFKKTKRPHREILRSGLKTNIL